MKLDLSPLDCSHCGMNTLEEYYAVLDSVWESAGLDEEVLCVGCLERRLGRILISEDFNKEAPINSFDFSFMSDRLKKRLGYETT